MSIDKVKELKTENNEVSRNPWIDFMRIFFCLWIILMHGESLYRDTTTGRMFEGGT